MSYLDESANTNTSAEIILTADSVPSRRRMSHTPPTRSTLKPADHKASFAFISDGPWMELFQKSVMQL